MCSAGPMTASAMSPCPISAPPSSTRSRSCSGRHRRIVDRDRASPQLDIRLAHDAYPLLRLCRDEDAERVGRVLAGLDIELCEAVDDVALADRLVQPGIEPGDDRRRRS